MGTRAVPGRQVRQETREPQDGLEPLEHRAQTELPGRLELQDALEQQDNKAHLVTQGPQACRVRTVVPETQEPQGLQAPEGRQEEQV